MIMGKLTVGTGVLLVIFLCASIMAVEIPPPNYQISAPTGQLQNEEMVWVSPTDSNVVMALWRDFRLGYRQLGLGRSTDAGANWTDGLFMDYRYDRQSDPAIDVDRDGNFYLCYMDYQALGGNRSGLSISKSVNNGITWNWPAHTYEAPEGYAAEDKQFFTIDRTDGPYSGNIYMAWNRFPSWAGGYPRIIFVKTDTSLSSWSDTILVGPNWDAPECGFDIISAGMLPMPIVGSDGAVYVFWCGPALDSCTFYTAIYMVKSTDGGDSFTEPVEVVNTEGGWSLGTYIDGTVDVYNSPMCAADIFGGPHDGNIYIAYSDFDETNTAFHDANIEFIRSVDGGTTWTDPIYVNDDVTGPGATFDQFHPWLYCNQEGTLVVLFYDQRMDVENHFLFDAFAAYSFDGGQSFTTNHRVSDVSSNPYHTAATTRAGKIGEYIGVTAFRDHVNAVWTDTRNGNQDVFGANWVIPMLEPRLVMPKDGEVSKSTPVLRWATAWKEHDDQYRVEVATDDGFENIVYTATLDSVATGTDMTLANGLYYWRAKAFMVSSGDSSEYSEVWSFIVDDYIPIRPALMLPSDKGVVGDSLPTFVWDGDQTAIAPLAYTLEISTDETFGDPAVLRQYSGLSDTAFVSPVRVYADSSYYWRVEAVNVFDESNGFTEPNEFSYVAFVCGDADGDMLVNLLDVLYLIDHLYGSPQGPAPDPQAAGDVNADGSVNLLDILQLIDFLYGEPPPPELICP